MTIQDHITGQPGAGQFLLESAPLGSDLAEACETVRQKGGLHDRDRRRVKTGTGY